MGRIDLKLTMRGQTIAETLGVLGGEEPPEELDYQLAFLGLEDEELIHGAEWTVLHESILFISGRRMGSHISFTDTKEPFDAIVDALMRHVSVYFPGVPIWLFEDVVLWLWRHKLLVGFESLTPTLLFMSISPALGILTNEWRLGFLGELLSVPGQTTEDLRDWSALSLPTVNWHLRQLVDLGALTMEDSRPIFYFVCLEFIRSLSWRMDLALELVEEV